MRKYIKCPEPVVALFWDGNHEALSDFLPEKSMISVSRGGELFLEGPRVGRIVVPPGKFYLVKNLIALTIEMVPKQYFEQTYVELPFYMPEEGRYASKTVIETKYGDMTVLMEHD